MKMVVIIKFLDEDRESMKASSGWMAEEEAKLQEKLGLREVAGNGEEDFSEARINAWLR